MSFTPILLIEFDHLLIYMSTSKAAYYSFIAVWTVFVFDFIWYGLAEDGGGVGSADFFLLKVAFVLNCFEYSLQG